MGPVNASVFSSSLPATAAAGRLTPAPAPDPVGRVYLYWRDERFAEESLQF
jgi:hypothetical protein